MDAWMPVAGVFVLGAAVVAGLLLGLARVPEIVTKRRLEGRLVEVSRGPAAEAEESGLLKTQPAGPLPVVDRMVNQLELAGAAARCIEQAGLRVSVSGMLLMTLGCGLLLAILARLVFTPAWGGILGFGVGLSIPLLVLHRMRIRRFRKFEEQFPEALDLISRAVRAGHAFTAGLKMVADEVSDPVGPEFRKTFDEQNFGLPLKDALTNLSERMPLLDVRFFATAVLIQRETGGNLAEILDNLSHVVRERFKILRQVRVHTAHGRLTGYVLLALPAFLAIALSFINPDHMNLLFRERLGQMMLGGAMVMQIIGYLWIQKVVKIEV